MRKPADATVSPRFANTGTFMRLGHVDKLRDLDYVLVGIPFDTGSSFRTGSRFGPQAIRNISAMMKPNNMQLGVNIFDSLHGADYGDIDVIPGYILETYDKIEKELSSILSHNIIPISMGGDHSISLGELRAIHKKHGPVSLLHFDSHADIDDEIFGQHYDHATPFRRAVEEGLINPHKSVQIGMRGTLYDPDEYKSSKELGFTMVTTKEVRTIGFEKLTEIIYDVIGDNKTFLSFDIDVVDPAYAPGTGTPEVGGFTSYEALEMVRATKDINFVGFDLVEVSPNYDAGEITAYLAANIICEFLSILAYQRNKK